MDGVTAENLSLINEAVAGSVAADIDDATSLQEFITQTIEDNENNNSSSGGNGVTVSLKNNNNRDTHTDPEEGVSDDQSNDEPEEPVDFTLLTTQEKQALVQELTKKVQDLMKQLRALQGNSAAVTEITTVRDLTVGMEGEDVRALQTLLIAEDTGSAARELLRVTATGYFSSYTKNALSEYQLAHGIVPSVGYFGVITRDQMKKAGLSGLWW